MKTHARVFVLALLCCTAAFVQAEQLTTVAVVDVAKVSQVFFRDSQAMRDIETMVSRFQEDLNKLSAELNDLREKKLEAEKAQNPELVLQLEAALVQKSSYIKEFHRVRTLQIQEQRNRVTESGGFLVELQKAMAFVAEDQGFNIIMNSNDPGLLWWGKSVDITDLVIQRLQQTIR